MDFRKKIIRELILPVSITMGMDSLVRNLAPKGLVNIMFHGVVNKSSTHFSPRNIDASQFDKVLKYLKENYEIISCKEAFNFRGNQKKWSTKTISISFDDGLKNNVDIALPILEHHEIPATFFITTSCLEGNTPNCVWAEKIAALRYFDKSLDFQIGNFYFENYFCKTTNQYIEDFLKFCSPQDRDNFIHELDHKFNIRAKLNSIDHTFWQLMNSEDLLKLSKSKIAEIGSHGHAHFNLGNIPLDCAKVDMEMSKSILEKLLNKEIDMIAFPDGSYNFEVMKLAESIGYKYQFAVNYLNEQNISDARIMKRFSVSSTTTYESNIMRLNFAFRNPIN